MVDAASDILQFVCISLGYGISNRVELENSLIEMIMKISQTVI